MTETVLPILYDNIKKKVDQLSNVTYISFTSDLWSTKLSVHYLISLTAHWLTDTFDKKRTILHAESFDEAQTGDHIHEKLTEMLDQCNRQ